MSRPAALAAIDCGTNSTRLLVADPGGETIERLMNITRLGAGVDRTGALEPAAIARTVSVLTSYREVMDLHRVEKVRMIATSAARDAVNRDEFFDAAEAAIGVRPELLSGREEGELSFAGATAGLSGDAEWRAGTSLIADIGGGSTELVAGTNAGEPLLATVSLEMGCVRLTERFLHSDPPSAAEIGAAAEHVQRLVDEAVSEHPGLEAANALVGLAGTVSALAMLQQGTRVYERDAIHHCLLRLVSVESMLSELAGETVEARRGRPGMEHDRADVIVGGAIALAGIMRRFGFEECLVSESDILDGMVIGLVHA